MKRTIKNVNMFTGQKALADRMNLFVEFHVSNISDSVLHRNRLNNWRKALASYQNLDGSIRQDNAVQMIAGLEQSIAKEIADYEALKKRKAKWTWTDADRDFYKSGDVVIWLKSYGFEVTKDTNICRDIRKAISGSVFASQKSIVVDNDWTAGRKINDVLKVAYAVIVEYMVEAGTLKTDRFPADVKACFDNTKKAQKPEAGKKAGKKPEAGKKTTAKKPEAKKTEAGQKPEAGKPEAK